MFQALKKDVVVTTLNLLLTTMNGYLMWTLYKHDGNRSKRINDYFRQSDIYGYVLKQQLVDEYVKSCDKLVYEELCVFGIIGSS